MPVCIHESHYLRSARLVYQYAHFPNGIPTIHALPGLLTDHAVRKLLPHKCGFTVTHKRKIVNSSSCIFFGTVKADHLLREAGLFAKTRML